MIHLLEEVPLLIDRITEKVPDFVLIDAFDNWPNGGNFEADNLPACLIGDSGDLITMAGPNSTQAQIKPYTFISVVTARNSEAFTKAQTLLNAVINSVLYEDNEQRWYPAGYDLPFSLYQERPETLYFPTYVMRNLLFNRPLRQLITTAVWRFFLPNLKQTYGETLPPRPTQHRHHCR